MSIENFGRVSGVGTSLTKRHMFATLASAEQLTMLHDINLYFEEKGVAKRRGIGYRYSYDATKQRHLLDRVSRQGNEAVRAAPFDPESEDQPLVVRWMPSEKVLKRYDFLTHAGRIGLHEVHPEQFDLSNFWQATLLDTFAAAASDLAESRINSILEECSSAIVQQSLSS